MYVGIEARIIMLIDLIGCDLIALALCQFGAQTGQDLNDANRLLIRAIRRCYRALVAELAIECRTSFQLAIGWIDVATGIIELIVIALNANSQFNRLLFRDRVTVIGTKIPGNKMMILVELIAAKLACWDSSYGR